jgi:hypothetical protein
MIAAALAPPAFARMSRRPGYQGQVISRSFGLHRFAHVIELNPDAVESPSLGTTVAPILDDDPLDRGKAPTQAHAIALAEGAGA